VVGEIISAIDARFRHKNAAVAAGAPRETLPMAAEAGLRVTDALWAAKTQVLWFVRIIVSIDGSQASPLPSPARGSLQPSPRLSRRSDPLHLRYNPEVSVRSRGRSADDGRCGATSLKPD
jgi:hypothetical protein